MLNRKKNDKNKSSIVVGIHDGHNSTVALLKDGKLSDVLQEERLQRIKNIGNFPATAFKDILLQEPLADTDVTIGFNGQHMSYGVWDKKDILQEYERSSTLTTTLKASAKKSKTIYSLYKADKVKDRIAALGKVLSPLPSDIQSVEHHTAHAAAAYYGWGQQDKVLVLTCDGCGDGLCATVNIGEDGKIKRIAKITEDNSIGRLYAYMTFLMGMMPLEHEYKIMGLAPYSGMSTDVQRVYKKFRGLFEFEKKQGNITWRRKQGVPSIYAPGQFLNKLVYRERFDWIAGGLQLFIEDFLKEWVANCIRETGIRRIALSGGVFMNVKANKALYELKEVDDIFVFPSCGDESNAIGVAYYSYAQAGGEHLKPLGPIYFGKEVNDENVEKTLTNYNDKNKIKIDHHENIEKTIAELLTKGEIVGRIKGRMEFGARALGNRSILANPSMPGVVRIINEMIKCRDFWMPFAPSVLVESSQRYFIKEKPVISPYMMLTFDTKPERRDKISAALHPFDYTARPQEVIRDWNPDYHKLIKYFEDMSGESLILNTSYNLHGHPIAYTAIDALEVFKNSGLKYLTLGNFLLKK